MRPCSRQSLHKYINFILKMYRIKIILYFGQLSTKMYSKVVQLYYLLCYINYEIIDENQSKEINLEILY